MKVGHVSINNFRGIKSLNARLRGDFICLIGAGDSCKTTVLSAIECALSQKWNLNFDDSDFYNQDVENPITILVTLYGWEDVDDVRIFFSESKFGQFIGGLTDDGPVPEPVTNSIPCVTIRLVITKSLEPKWAIVKGEDEKAIGAGDRKIFGLGRIDEHLDSNFTWGRNTILTKLSSETSENLTEILSSIARTAKNTPLSIDGCDLIAQTVKSEAVRFGVRLGNVFPKIDIQKVGLANGALSLHEDAIPLRNFGTGSKKLISCAMHVKLHSGRNLILVDEIEVGLEPHRIRGLIKNLKATNRQIIATSHSAAVIRELTVVNNELYVSQKDTEANVSLKSLADVPESQAPIRSNAEAFLGRKIVVSEGPTEIGCLRALDEHKKNQGAVPVWTLSTAYFNAGGIGNVKGCATKLKSLGYTVSVFCDNDTLDQFTQADINELSNITVKTINWEENNSIEKQLFKDIPWAAVPGLLRVVAKAKEKSVASFINSITVRISGLSEDYEAWQESASLREQLGLIAGGKNLDGTKNENWSPWFKRIDLSEDVFKYALTYLQPSSLMTTKLNELWDWVQNA